MNPNPDPNAAAAHTLLGTNASLHRAEARNGVRARMTRAHERYVSPGGDTSFGAEVAPPWTLGPTSWKAVPVGMVESTTLRTGKTALVLTWSRNDDGSWNYAGTDDEKKPFRKTVAEKDTPVEVLKLHKVSLAAKLKSPAGLGAGAGAVAGFMVGGPIGGLVGAAIGYFAGGKVKPKVAHPVATPATAAAAAAPGTASKAA